MPSPCGRCGVMLPEKLKRWPIGTLVVAHLGGDDGPCRTGTVEYHGHDRSGVYTRVRFAADDALDLHRCRITKAKGVGQMIDDGKLSKQRVARFRIRAEPGGRPFDGGKTEATITIRTDGQDPAQLATISVRPKRGKEVTENLQTIARILIEREAARRTGFDARPRRRRR